MMHTQQQIGKNIRTQTGMTHEKGRQKHPDWNNVGRQRPQLKPHVDSLIRHILCTIYSMPYFSLVHKSLRTTL